MDSDPPQFIPVSCLISTVVSSIPSLIPALSLALLYHLQYWGLVSILYKDCWKPASRILNTVRMYVCVYVCTYVWRSPLCLVILLVLLSGINASKEVGLVVNSKGKLNLCSCLVICYQNSGHNYITVVDNKYFYNVANIRKNKDDCHKQIYIHEELKSASNSGNVFYHSVRNTLSSCVLFDDP
jgi:hypothetical protein